VQAIKRVAQILDLFSLEKDELGVSEISRETGLPKGTTHRILRSLTEENFLEQGEDGNYRPGVMLFNLGKIVENNISIIKVASPVLKELSKKHVCASHLAFLDGKDVVYIDKHVSNHFFEFASKIGMRVPAYATALGKIMLAYLDEEKVRKLFEGFHFQSFTPNTISNINSLLQELRICRERGYAIDNEEICQGLKCYAVPVFNLYGEVEAGMSLSKPTSLVEEEEEERIISSLVKGGQIVSNRMSGQTTDDI